MSLTLQAIVTTKNPPSSARALLSPIHFINFNPRLSLSSNSTTHFPIHSFFTSQSRLSSVRKINASFDPSYGASKTPIDYEFNFDGFLSILEFLCLASSAAVSIYVALGDVLQKLGSKVLVWQFAVLASGAVIGAVIRRRQWRRICGAGISRGSGSHGANLTGRVEKLEEDLRDSATIIRVMSRQIEKLGDRVRVTRKTLKEPIAEIAALAQKNSEVTRALAAQEDALEKELGEIQKVLLAMQEQQHKQLELILAIAKAGKLCGSEQLPTKDQKAVLEHTRLSADGAPKLEVNPIN